ncbi:MAG: hypothetical protein ACKO2G_09220 [Verrucomicrobiales bacterium]
MSWSKLAIPSRWQPFVWAIIFVFSSFLFLERAAENGARVNTRMNRTDQGAYADLVLRMRVKDFNFQADRNRMPLYPALMALGVEKDWDKPKIFEAGKIWNTWLALASLVIIGTIFFRSLPVHAAANALYFLAFTVFLFKAPHLQAEILYYLLFFLCFAAGWRLFRNPSPWLAVGTGVLAGLTHLTKASVAPAILCFVVYHLLDTLWRGWRFGFDRGQWVRRLLVPTLVVVAFLGTVWNYISESKRVYGHYFYNVNSTFYFWCESWEDATSRTRAAGDRDGWPDLPPDQIPSAGNYLKKHGVAEIPARIVRGADAIWDSMKNSYGYLPFVIALGAACVFVMWRRRLLLRRWFRKRPATVLALLSFFGGYFLLIAWYSQIISGNRFILGLFLPFVFTCMLVLGHWGQGIDVRIRGKVYPFLPWFHRIFSFALLLVIIRICTHRILFEYGGS